MFQWRIALNMDVKIHTTHICYSVDMNSYECNVELVKTMSQRIQDKIRFSMTTPPIWYSKGKINNNNNHNLYFFSKKKINFVYKRGHGPSY